MSSEVGSGQVSIVPTFKGFRKAVTAETDASAKAGASGFKKAFSRTGSDAGKTTGKGFKAAFEGASAGFSGKATKQLEADVARASKALSAARLKQQDAVGKVTIAEAKLADVQRRYKADSPQVVAAVEGLASATRRLNAANDVTRASTDSLNSAQGRLASAADRAGDGFRRAGSTWGTKLKSGFSSVFTGSFLGTLASNIALSLGRGIRAGLTSVATFIEQSVTSASDLQQSLGAVDAIFGKYADSVHKQSKSAATDVGLSRNAYNELASVLGAQLKGLGTPIDQVATKTSQLISLGADLSAQFGGPTSDAVEALSSLFKGEFDPIEKYGISIKQSTVNAKAAALGFKAVDGAFSSQATAAATLALIYDKTRDAQGQWAAQQDTYAEKAQTAAAKWQDVSAKVGTAFLPVATKVADMLSTKVIPAISELVDKNAPDLQKAFEDALPSMQQFADDVLPQLPGLIKSFVQALPGLIILLEGLLGLITVITQNVAAFTQGWTSLSKLLSGDKSLNDVYQTLTTLPGPLGTLIGGVTRLAAAMGSSFGNAARAVGLFAGQVGFNIGVALSFIGGLKDRVVGALTGAATWLVSSGRALIQGFISGIRQMFGPVGDAVGGIINWAKGFFPHSPAKRGPLSGQGWTDIERSGEAVILQWNKGLQKRSSVVPDVSLLAVAGGSAAGATVAGARGAVDAGVTYQFNGPITAYDPEEVARQIEKRRRRAARPYRAIIGAG